MAELIFKTLEEADIPFGMELKNIAKWNQTEADWRRYLLYEPSGCFVAIYDQEPAGTVITINYGNRFGWVGMVLVHPQKRRKGIGTALLNKAITYLKESGVETVKLDATPEGKKVYVPLGFLEEYELDRRQGRGVAMNCEEFPAIIVADLNDIIRFDAGIFGAERGNVLKSLLKENPDRSFIARDSNGQIAGYIMARKGWDAYQIGPWVSKSASAAEGLFALVLTKLAGERIFFDVPRMNENGVEIAEKYGFTIQRSFTRMFLGNNAYPGEPSYVYSISSPEKG